MPKLQLPQKNFLLPWTRPYTNLFQHADFPYSDTFPECFSYEFEGSVYVSLPVAHAIGDYILAAYTPENK